MSSEEKDAFARVRSLAKRAVNRREYAKEGLERLEAQKREQRRKVAECNAIIADLRAEYPEWDGKVKIGGKWVDAG